ncbi:MAG TPA: phosphodiester glycosidase family protein [Sporichthya sp.]|nr:phosphodiester glycosidase family protein [Sporichthya sp.]
MGKSIRRSMAPTMAAGAAMTLLGAYAVTTMDTSNASDSLELQAEPARGLPVFTDDGVAEVGAMLAGLSERTAEVRTIEQQDRLAAELAPPQMDSSPRNSRRVPSGCRGATALLSHNPVREFGLPGGAAVRVWDTGARANPMDETRLVAVRIPKGTLTPTVLTPSSTLGSLATPSSMGDDHGKAVVVINGGVYDTSTNIPTGALATDDKARKADSLGTRAIAIYDGLKSAVVARTGLNGLLTSSRGDVPVSAINWEELSRQGLSAYTHSWNASRHPAGPRTVVVRDGKVRQILSKAAGMRRPGSGETFLTAPAGSRAFGALKALRVGDAVKVSTAVESVREDYSDRPELAQPSALIGVSAALVRYGKVIAPCSDRDNQLRPRSAIGWTENGDMLVVSVSGRAMVGGSRYGGASAFGLGQYLKWLGAVSAVNLDGGGSTALLVRREVGGPLNRIDRDDDAEQRPVANALAFKTD